MSKKGNAQCRAYAEWYRLQLLEWRDDLVNRMMQQGGPALRSAYRLHMHLGWRESLCDFVIRWCEPSPEAKKEYRMLKRAYRDYLDLWTIITPKASNPKNLQRRAAAHECKKEIV